MLNLETYQKQLYFECTALVVDINSSEMMFRSDEANLVGQFTRDTLSGAVRAVEEAGGSVINHSGDSIIAVMPNVEAAAEASWSVAHDFRKTKEYLVGTGLKTVWPFVPDDFGLKISMESGTMEVSTIWSKFLGEQPFITGPPSVYASRMLSFGEGNRCLVGPIAAEGWPYETLAGPFIGQGKHAEIKYEYFLYDLSDLWED
jgi:class 3 adenylate cyclase